MICICLVSFAQLLYNVNCKDQLRLNHGVIFRDTNKLIAQTENIYTYVFVVPFPNTTDFANHVLSPIDCSGFILNGTSAMSATFDANCYSIQEMVDLLNNATRRFVLDLNDTIGLVKSLTPHYEINSDSRDRREHLFSFAGEIWNVLTGAPSERTFNKLQDHVTQFEQSNVHLRNRLGKLSAGFDAYMHLQDHKYHDLVESLVTNNHLIGDKFQELVGRIGEDYRKFAHNWSMWSSFLTQLENIFMVTIDHYRKNLVLQGQVSLMRDSWLLGLNSLSSARLPSNIIHPGVLQEALMHIISDLDNSSSHLDLSVGLDNLEFYYGQARASGMHTEANLYISLEVPLVSASTNLIFNIFESIVFPIPVHNSSSAVTQVMNVPSFYGISVDGSVAISINLQTWSSCHGLTVLHCDSILEVRKFSDSFCVDALFQDRGGAILSACDYSVKRQTSAVLFRFSDYVIIKNNRGLFHLDCDSNKTDYITCPSVCLLKLPCRCKLQDKSRVLTADSEMCGNHRAVEKFYGFNMFFLNKYFKTLPQTFLTGGSTLSTLPYIDDLPNISADFLETLDSNLRAADKEIDVDVLSPQSDDYTYFQLPEIIQNSAVHDMLSVLSALVLGLLMVVVVYLSFRLHSLAAQLEIMQTQILRTRAASFRTVSQLQWNVHDVTARVQVAPPSVQDSEMSVHHVSLSVVLLATLCGVLVFMFLWRKLRHRPDVSLSLLVFTDYSHVLVNLLRIDLPLKHLEFEGRLILNKVRLSKGNCLTYMTISWNDLRIKYNNISIVLPDRYRVSLADYRKLEVLNSQKYISALIIRHKGLILGYIGFIPTDVRVPMLETGRGLWYSKLTELNYGTAGLNEGHEVIRASTRSSRSIKTSESRA